MVKIQYIIHENVVYTRENIIRIYVLFNYEGVYWGRMLDHIHAVASIKCFTTVQQDEVDWIPRSIADVHWGAMTEAR
jgi:hypothetical protein